MKRFIGAVLLLGCHAERAAAPAAEGSAVALANVASTSPNVALAVASGADDAADRLAPRMDAAVRTQLVTQLRRLSASLAGGKTADVFAATAAARALLARSEVTPNAAAIELVLERAESLLL
jgi:hypothetical protein